MEVEIAIEIIVEVFDIVVEISGGSVYRNVVSIGW